MPISGTISVPITKPFVFTRVTYSRLMISQSLRMGGFLDEDFVERRFEQLEPDDLRSRLHGGSQNFLRVRARFQFGFHARGEPVHGGNRGVIQKSIGTREFDVRGVLAVGLLDRAQVAIENAAAVIDQANGIAHFLDLLHAMPRENDCRASVAHFEHHVLDRGGVHGIKPGERLVQNDDRRAVNHRSDELHFLLHAFREIHDLFFRPFAQLETLEPFAGAAVGLRFRKAVQRGEKNNQGADLHSGIEAALLGQVADRVARFIADRLAENQYRALVRNENIHDHADGGGLAGAVGSEQSEDGALAHTQVDAADRVDRVVRFADVFDRGGVHGFPFLLRPSDKFCRLLRLSSAAYFTDHYETANATECQPGFYSGKGWPVVSRPKGSRKRPKTKGIAVRATGTPMV